MGVGNQRVVVREIALPAMPEKELRQSLGFQVQEFIPMPVEEAVLDYHLIEELEIEGRPMLRLLLVAAQKAMVDTLVAAATGAKVEPMGLDLVPFAWSAPSERPARAWSSRPPEARPSSTWAPT